jgi:hypothetical protein
MSQMTLLNNSHSPMDFKCYCYHVTNSHMYLDLFLISCLFLICLSIHAPLQRSSLYLHNTWKNLSECIFMTLTFRFPSYFSEKALLRYNLHTTQFAHSVYDVMDFNIFTDICNHHKVSFRIFSSY